MKAQGQQHSAVDAPGPWATRAAARAAASRTARANSVSCVNPGAAAGACACDAAASPWCCWCGGAASEAGVSKPLRRTRFTTPSLPSSLSRDRDLLLSRPPLRHMEARRVAGQGWVASDEGGGETLALLDQSTQQAKGCAAARAAVNKTVALRVVARQSALPRSRDVGCSCWSRTWAPPRGAGCQQAPAGVSERYSCFVWMPRDAERARRSAETGATSPAPHGKPLRSRCAA